MLRVELRYIWILYVVSVGFCVIFSLPCNAKSFRNVEQVTRIGAKFFNNFHNYSIDTHVLMTFSRDF